MLAIFCCVRCILYPNTQIIITSGTKGQALEIIEKIVNILMPESANLRLEVKDYGTNPTNGFVQFHNGSIVRIAASNQNSRHFRANIVIVDEYRMVEKEIINDVFKKFLTSQREPNFLKKPEYANYPKERNQQLYASSCWFKSHWSWNLVTDHCLNMMNDKMSYFVCGLPYQLSIAENLLDRDFVEEEMSETNFDAIKYAMEMGCFWWGENDNAFFNYESLTKVRRIKQALYPAEQYKLFDSKIIKYSNKVAGEIRLLTADIAVMSSKKRRNDSTAIFVLQLTPTKDGQYIRNVLYADNFEGGHTEMQALRIRKLYEDLECDYIIIDTSGVGIGVYDSLVKDLIDEETGIMYEALTCINDPEMAAHYKGASKAPRKVIYSIKASSSFNSQCAWALRDSINRGKLRLLLTEQEFRTNIKDNAAYKKLSPDDKLTLEMPYIQTTLLVTELVNLNYVINGTDVKIKEDYNKRKDRYSALSYGNYIANELENKIKRHVKTNSHFYFEMRAAKPKGR